MSNEQGKISLEPILQDSSITSLTETDGHIYPSDSSLEQRCANFEVSLPETIHIDNSDNVDILIGPYPSDSYISSQEVNLDQSQSQSPVFKIPFSRKLRIRKDRQSLFDSVLKDSEPETPEVPKRVTFRKKQRKSRPKNNLFDSCFVTSESEASFSAPVPFKRLKKTVNAENRKTNAILAELTEALRDSTDSDANISQCQPRLPFKSLFQKTSNINKEIFDDALEDSVCSDANISLPQPKVPFKRPARKIRSIDKKAFDDALEDSIGSDANNSVSQPKVPFKRTARKIRSIDKKAFDDALEDSVGSDANNSVSQPKVPFKRTARKIRSIDKKAFDDVLEDSVGSDSSNSKSQPKVPFKRLGQKAKRIDKGIFDDALEDSVEQVQSEKDECMNTGSSMLKQIIYFQREQNHIKSQNTSVECLQPINLEGFCKAQAESLQTTKTRSSVISIDTIVTGDALDIQSINSRSIGSFEDKLDESVKLSIVQVPGPNNTFTFEQNCLRSSLKSGFSDIESINSECSEHTTQPAKSNIETKPLKSLLSTSKKTGKFINDSSIKPKRVSFFPEVLDQFSPSPNQLDNRSISSDWSLKDCPVETSINSESSSCIQLCASAHYSGVDGSNSWFSWRKSEGGISTSECNTSEVGLKGLEASLQEEGKESDQDEDEDKIKEKVEKTLQETLLLEEDAETTMQEEDEEPEIEEDDQTENKETTRQESEEEEEKSENEEEDQTENEERSLSEVDIETTLQEEQESKEEDEDPEIEEDDQTENEETTLQESEEEKSENDQTENEERSLSEVDTETTLQEEQESKEEDEEPELEEDEPTENEKTTLQEAEEKSENEEEDQIEEEEKLETEEKESEYEDDPKEENDSVLQQTSLLEEEAEPVSGEERESEEDEQMSERSDDEEINDTENISNNEVTNRSPLEEMEVVISITPDMNKCESSSNKPKAQYSLRSVRSNNSKKLNTEIPKAVFKEPKVNVPSKRKFQEILDRIPLSELKKNKRKCKSQELTKVQMEQNEIEKELSNRKKTKKSNMSDKVKLSNKLAKPIKWIKMGIYKVLIEKLTPQFGIKARIRAENVVKSLGDQVKKIIDGGDIIEICTEMKDELAMFGIVKTHNDFFWFVHSHFDGAFLTRVYPRGLLGGIVEEDAFENIL